MIGVVIHPDRREIVQEFFELFKTPWEFVGDGRSYAVVLAVGDPPVTVNAPLVLHYATGGREEDQKAGVRVSPVATNALLEHAGRQIPLYGECVTFSGGQGIGINEATSGLPAAYLARRGEQLTVRLGFDLFAEIQFLLSHGQPANHARMPSLELHIALLRDMILGASIPLVELPPIPAGHRFMVCLTHDVDHPVMRRHFCDHTMFGFLFRAVAGSVANVARGRATLLQLLRNWATALTLPLVYLGWLKDTWFGFDRYLEVEQGLGSTFYVIPWSGRPGLLPPGNAPARRAARYELSDVAPHLEKFRQAGCEVGTHGIDAWTDSERGREERGRLAQYSDACETGVRMHWLYFGGKSPQVLEQGGFTYDSSFGYNNTVGFRAGTLQAFKPPGVTHLLELPLAVMDTALFYPSYLNLSPRAARTVVDDVVNVAERFGGALTVNWHDRSLAPERQWDRFYLDLLTDLKRRNAWFPTAARAVTWFRNRRAVRFERVVGRAQVIRVNAAADSRPAGVPGVTVRIHRPRAGARLENGFEARSTADANTQDIALTGSVELSLEA